VPPIKPLINRHIIKTCWQLSLNNSILNFRTSLLIFRKHRLTLPSGLFGLFNMSILVLLLNLLASSCGSSFQSALEMTLPSLHYIHSSHCIITATINWSNVLTVWATKMLWCKSQSINQSINQSIDRSIDWSIKIYIAPYVAIESEAHRRRPKCFMAAWFKCNCTSILLLMNELCIEYSCYSRRQLTRSLEVKS